MPNVTISVSEELKTEMDTFTEVNWSEVARNAIALYIEQRKSPNPKIEIDLRNAMLNHIDYHTGFPTLAIDLKIINKSSSEITIDRILSIARFIKDSNYHVIGRSSDLHIRFLKPNDSIGATLYFPILREKINELKFLFDKSFECCISCEVFGQGFNQGYHQEVRATIPIDIWQNMIKKTVGTM